MIEKFDKKYEIFISESDGIEKTNEINMLFGYPNEKTKTETYRKLIKKYDDDLWAGIVDDSLVNACSNISPTEILTYYDGSDLKEPKYLIDNGWYEP